jgi:hypothetical protein
MATPIVVHRPSETLGRCVTLRARRVGLAHSDHGLVVLLEAAGLPDAGGVRDDLAWVLRGAAPHHRGEGNQIG